MENPETNSTKNSILEKIARGVIDRKPSDSKDYHTWREFRTDMLNRGIKLSALGITLSGSILYALGKCHCILEKKWGENDAEREQKYERSVKQHYSEKYQSRVDNWTFH